MLLTNATALQIIALLLVGYGAGFLHARTRYLPRRPAEPRVKGNWVSYEHGMHGKLIIGVRPRNSESLEDDIVVAELRPQAGIDMDTALAAAREQVDSLLVHLNAPRT